MIELKPNDQKGFCHGSVLGAGVVGVSKTLFAPKKKKKRKRKLYLFDLHFRVFDDIHQAI